MHSKILKMMEQTMAKLLDYREQELKAKAPLEYDYLLDSINALDDAIGYLDAHIADNA